jgi:monomeric isocitrate dehydrogenase
MAKYSQKAQEHIDKTLHLWKEGKLKSSTGDVVASQEQALAIAISEAREKGYKVPDDPDDKKED